MSGLRIVILGERFWPVVDPWALAMEHLGGALSDLGMQVTYVTCKWEKGWPDWFPVGAAQVRYVSAASRSLFVGQRPARQVQQMLESRANEIDALVISGSGEFLSVPLRIARQRRTPCLVWIWTGHRLRNEAICDELSAIEWSAAASEPVRVVYEQADFAERWIDRGLPSELLVYAEPSIELPRDVARLTRASVRASLTQLDPRLRIAERQQVCLVLGPIVDRDAWLRLLQAWPHLQRHERGARLWLMGDGEGFAKLWEHARRYQDQDAIDFLGWFDDLDDVFEAVDLLIVPDRAPLEDRFALRAMAVGLPVLALGPAERDGEAARFVHVAPAGAAGELAAEIASALQSGRRALRVTAAQNWVSLRRDMAVIAGQAERWIQQLRAPQPQAGT